MHAPKINSFQVKQGDQSYYRRDNSRILDPEGLYGSLAQGDNDTKANKFVQVANIHTHMGKHATHLKIHQLSFNGSYCTKLNFKTTICTVFFQKDLSCILLVYISRFMVLPSYTPPFVKLIRLISTRSAQENAQLVTYSCESILSSLKYWGSRSKLDTEAGHRHSVDEKNHSDQTLIMKQLNY